MAHMMEITMMSIECLGTLLNMSMPISNIFCPIAVEIARKAPIGINNQMYFLMILKMRGNVARNTDKKFSGVCCVSYFKHRLQTKVIMTMAMMPRNPCPHRLVKQKNHR